MASKKGKKKSKAKPQSNPPVEETKDETKATEAKAEEEQDETSDDEGAGEDVEESKAEETPAAKEPSEPPKKAEKKATKAASGGKSEGVLALFDRPDTILEAAKKARDRGFKKWDVYTPFPIHGMDEAMGMGRSPVPWITFSMGVVGLCAAIIIQFGTMVYSWPINYGGKPFAAWPSFVPISFEMTVLLAGVSTAIGSLFLGGVFKLRKRIAHPDVTSHRFAIFVEASDPKYDEGKTLSLFEDAGAIEVRAVKEGE